MNIFVVNHSPRLSAQELCDKHVVKMIVESAQMLSTAHRVYDGSSYIDTSGIRKIKRWKHHDPEWDQKLCKAVMINHPCTKWAMESIHNYIWLFSHGYELCKEYSFRYNKIHKMQSLYEIYLSQVPTNLQSSKTTALTPFAQAMPEYYKNKESAIIAYQTYYISEKSKFARWTRRDPPTWYLDGLRCINTNNKGVLL